MTGIQPGDHKGYMQLALELARKSPPKPTNFCVGAVIVDSSSNEVLATGYTLELPGNTHAEQCCLMKLAEKHGVSEENLKDVLPTDLVLYTTVEPCSKRLSGNLPCAERVKRLAGCIKTVYVGILEPDTFVSENPGLTALKDAGIAVVAVKGLEAEIFVVATAGHVKPTVQNGSK
ncbi:cytidine deaminase-like protein [Cladorrhinum sp. PSN259]|nr:cytidine deaminase-like protein [Cladorrhinum sp. PSN259]